MEIYYNPVYDERGWPVFTMSERYGWIIFRYNDDSLLNRIEECIHGNIYDGEHARHIRVAP